MSMTVWVHTLEGRQLTSHQDDHTLISKFTPELDAVCKSLCVAPISSFLDYTDLNASMSEEEDVESEELDAETGWSYGIDDMSWFSAKDGLSTINALRAHLANDKLPGLSHEDYPDLLEEFDSCITKLREPASRDAKFHLAVVM